MPNESGAPIKMIGTVRTSPNQNKRRRRSAAAKNNCANPKRWKPWDVWPAALLTTFNNLFTVIGGYCAMSLQTTR